MTPWRNIHLRVSQRRAGRSLAAWRIGGAVGSLALGLALAAVLGGCDAGAETPHANTPQLLATPAPAEGYGVAAVRVAELRRVAVQPEATQGHPPFYVQPRLGKIGRYPCAGCHSQPLERLQAQLRADEAPTHSDIRRVEAGRAHAGRANVGCRDCHDDAAGMSALRTLDGRSVSFDHSYQVCAQCHFEQANAWAGGGHGKRLVGWSGPRVVLNCAACHNPHDPLNPVSTPRWPVIAPNAPLKSEHAEGGHR